MKRMRLVQKSRSDLHSLVPIHARNQTLDEDRLVQPSSQYQGATDLVRSSLD
jgi:hypothetical protein